MHPHHETNPHFVRPRQELDDQAYQPTVPLVPLPQQQTKRSKPSKGSQSSRPDKHVQPSTAPKKHKPRHRDDDHIPPSIVPVRLKDQPQHHDDEHIGPSTVPGKHKPRHRDDEHIPPSIVPVGLKDQPQHHDDEHIGPSSAPVQHKDKTSQPPIAPVVPLQQPDHDGKHPQQQRRHPGLNGSPAAAVLPHQQSRAARPHSLWLPRTQRTNLLTWFGAVFCAIFWIVVIIGGIVILIVYLVFRPRSPRFDVSSATLNSAYLDMGELLNADLTVLANFTNPNKKMSVDFSYLTIDLFYGKTLIARQYLEPFAAAKRQTKFAYIHMVTSQVRLPILEIRRLNRQLETNGVMLEVKGYFRARSNFGRLLRYSYWLHSRCIIMVTRPPDGTLIASKCKTKH